MNEKIGNFKKRFSEEIAQVGITEEQLAQFNYGSLVLYRALVLQMIRGVITEPEDVLPFLKVYSEDLHDRVRRVLVDLDEGKRGLLIRYILLFQDDGIDRN